MVKRIIIPIVCSVLAATALLLPACTGTATSDSGAGDFIRGSGQQAIHSLTGKELSNDQRQDRFRTFLNRTFDVPFLARFALGSHWRTTSREQRKEYAKLFEGFIVQVYAPRFKNYNGEVFKVGHVRQINERDSLVHSELSLNNGQKIIMHWRVRGKADPKIVDVIIDGVSLALSHRDEFASVVNNNGGKIDGLFMMLRRKTEK